ncbi:isoamylase early set domain-containing protein [Streptomyces sp. HUAS TT3]|uniref:isoamylase early set domain-containing protein n=1 Tax=Streptomyces sp. HUAS TT3 TaxID=3447510 RepID=UPI003F660018
MVLERNRLRGRTEITSVLPEHIPDGSPSAHPLQPRGDGTRAAAVALRAPATRHFHYRAAGDYWFNDETTDSHNATSSHLHT